ncbi:MAG: catalase [Bacteriovoracaceae bacterium]|nr:catalase [Bacteriovoracaceae bacterium]
MKNQMMSVAFLALVAPGAMANFYNIQPPTEQGEIWTSKEEANVEEVARVFKETLIEATGEAPVMRRDAHPKAHGCVQGSLEITPEFLKPAHRVGLFKESKTYKTITRFSNGDPNQEKEDAKADVRGMATKILNPTYTNLLQEASLEEDQVHDLVFMNSDEFFISNPFQYEKFMNATQGRFSVLAYLLTHWRSLGVILKARQKIANPLDINYRSATPYKIGPNSMKMKFETCKKHVDKMPKKPSENFLSEKLKDSLASSEQCFDFMVQINKDPKTNDIEDAIQKWSTKKSPYVKVGKLTIAKQSGFLSSQSKEQCEKMTFNPWRAPMANRPLGGLNRVRLEVYLRQFDLRTQYNQK